VSAPAVHAARDFCLAPERADAPVYGGRYADPESFRAVQPDWTPTLPARDGRFGLADILVPAEP
jgi:hypothetical protein